MRSTAKAPSGERRGRHLGRRQAHQPGSRQPGDAAAAGQRVCAIGRRHGRADGRSKPASNRGRFASSRSSVRRRPQQGVEAARRPHQAVCRPARKAGMKISDDAIVHYLDELGRGRVSREDMRAIIQRMQAGGGRASIAYIFDALRDEMLARNYPGQLPVLARHRYARRALAGLAASERPRRARSGADFRPRSFWSTCRSRRTPNCWRSSSRRTIRIDLSEARSAARFCSGGMELPSRHPGFAIPRKIDVQFIEAELRQVPHEGRERNHRRGNREVSTKRTRIRCSSSWTRG